MVNFTNNDFELDVRADLENETIWLTQEEMSLLFNSDRTRITRHINNILKDGELEENSNVRKTHFPHSDKPVKLYNLDMIISVGYRVKSQRGILFRRWANKVLKEYLIQGVAVNQKRIETLNKVVDIQTRMLSYALDIDKEELIKVIDDYTKALDLLNEYDHQINSEFINIKSVQMDTYSLFWQG